MTQGLVIAAPMSGSGKTTIALGLLRALSRYREVRGAKSGPDYIDPRFHEAACGLPCMTLDAWAMTSERLRSLTPSDGLLIVEGAMGLFDGAPPDALGSTANLSKILDIPVILVVDCSRTGQSVAAMVQGFVHHDKNVRFAGLILNNIASPRHDAMCRRFLQTPDMPPIVGAIPRHPALVTRSRHLGLVQAQERSDMDNWLDQAADIMEENVDLDAITGATLEPPHKASRLRPPAQTIAVANDVAFSFTYPHMIADWHHAGAELTFFSPLNNDTVPDCDFIYLPGGYPELYAGRLASNSNFIDTLRARAQTSDIYGECGGYMMLGDALIDADGTSHAMASLLRLETSFAHKTLHLGYRHLRATTGPLQGSYKGHEFHYAITLKAEGAPLFAARDASDTPLADMGLRSGRVQGSFAHIIDATLS